MELGHTKFFKKFFCHIDSQPLIEADILLRLLRQPAQRAYELKQRRVLMDPVAAAVVVLHINVPAVCHSSAIGVSSSVWSRWRICITSSLVSIG